MTQLQVERNIRLAESELIRRAVCKDEAAIRDDGEAEDVLQEAYLRAFSALAEFRGDSSLATWLTRIVLNEALQRRRRRTEAPVEQIEPPNVPGAQIIPFPLSGSQPTDPERAMAQREICQLLERAIDELPQEFRTVLVARVIEGMSIEETADLLGLRTETVKTRLHRARRLLKAALADNINPLFSNTFPFDGWRCERLTNAVVKRLGLSA